MLTRIFETVILSIALAFALCIVGAMWYALVQLVAAC